jgi:hypothetical protein
LTNIPPNDRIMTAMNKKDSGVSKGKVGVRVTELNQRRSIKGVRKEKKREERRVHGAAFFTLQGVGYAYFTSPSEANGKPRRVSHPGPQTRSKTADGETGGSPRIV